MITRCTTCSTSVTSVHQLGLRGQQQAQRNRQRQFPLAHRNMRDDVVDQVGSRLRHAPRAARGAKPASLAAEGDELVVAAIATAQAQEAVRQDAALKKRVELVLDELRQAGAGLLGLGEEGLSVLLHQAVQRGLLGTVALVLDRRAIRRPVGLPTDGLHALLTSRLWWFTVSDGAAPRHRTEWGLPCDAHLTART